MAIKPVGHGEHGILEPPFEPLGVKGKEATLRWDEAVTFVAKKLEKYVPEILNFDCNTILNCE